MEKTSRRNLLRAAAAGGAVAAGLGAVIGSRPVTALGAGDTRDAAGHEHGGQNGKPLSGNHAQATVSFGQWDADANQPFDRYPLNSDRFRNVHELLPFEVEIDEGGAVSFIISGVHQVVVYDDSQTLAAIQATAKDPANHFAGVPPLVNHKPGLVFRGLDPRLLTYATQVLIPPSPTPVNLLVQDRVESINLPQAGRYLVVCGVVPHLLEGMHGFITVREKRPE